MTGNNRENVVALLSQAQKVKGGLSREVMEEIAKSLNVPVGEVFGVATFYSFLSTHPAGKYVIRVCKSLPCYMKNSEEVLKVISGELGIGPGEITPDGKFSLEETNCIGACDNSPAMLINDVVYGNLTPERIRKILAELA